MATAIPGSLPPLSTVNIINYNRLDERGRGSDPAATAPPAERRAGRSQDELALSIRKDGGLSLLQAELNRKIEGLFAEAGPAAVFDGTVDVSPEATAARIVGFALGFNLTYRAQNPGQDDEQARTGFEAEIRRGIEDGFGSARGVLSGLQMLDGEVQSNVDRTYQLVQEMLAEAFARD